MARSDAVWGIDVGQCALKAIRLRPAESKQQVIADAFDFIEYPKILSQPGAEPAELINDALKQFLSRNSLRGDRVAISVPGQAGLARFIKLPPVEVKKIPDIVRFEARQQIPFDLNDVIWDYQRMGGGSEEEGFALETEVGLFAMKRDAVARALEPFRKVGIELDFVQLTPLALYNYAFFDQLKDLPAPEDYDPDDPPGSIVVISLGTDATDLVVTNGFRVWQRSVPIGGNHFTKALTKELKLTFAKAEHLKRNAAAAQDSKAIYHAMRPVFNDLLTELQRSIGYFSNLNRTARIDRVVALGNAMKLPGLRKFLSQNLSLEIEKIDAFKSMTGSQITAVPAFRENVLSFAVSYGLALQGLGRGGLTTNLLPKEIVQERLIRRKKPWAVAAAALLLLACSVGFAGHTLRLKTVDKEVWKSATQTADSVKQQSGALQQDATKAQESFKEVRTIGDHLVSNVEGRIAWLELLRVVNECLPSDPADKLPADIAARNQLHITQVDVKRVPALEDWFKLVQTWYQPIKGPAASAAPTTGGGDAAASGGSAAGGAPAAAGPTGPGCVITLRGYHYHNNPGGSVGAQYVRDTFFRNLETKTFELPVAGGRADSQNPDGTPRMERLSATDLGIGYPVVLRPKDVYPVQLLPPGASQTSGSAPAAAQLPTAPELQPVEVSKYDFEIQFSWQFTPPSKREESRIAREKAAQQAPDAASQNKS